MNIEAYIEDLKMLYATLGEVAVKPINYGMQLTIAYGSQKVVLNVYNGKKGLKYVWGGVESSLKKAAMEMLPQAGVGTNSGCSNAKADPKSASKANRVGGVGLADNSTTLLLEGQPGFDGAWIGSDESGKGDYFGPLVVAAVYLDVPAAKKLIEAGIKDCKVLTDKKMPELEKLVKQIAPAYSVLVMKPQAYNMRYQQIKEQGGNLNNFLGLGHETAISRVMEQRPDCHFALIDQFTKSPRVLQALQRRFPKLKVTQRPKAEADIAVAAASVLARAAFLTAMAELAEEAGVGQLPKGGGPGATAMAKNLAAGLGQEQLVNFVKLHFANTNKI